MNTDEMIEVMQAHARGEIIEVSDKGANDWSEIKYPLWDWNSFEYRVKPAKKVTLNKRFISKQLSNIAGLIDTDVFICEGEFVSADDVLWYWEYQDADGHWEKSDYRATRAEIEKLSNFHNFAPLYALGFRLKDEK